MASLVRDTGTTSLAQTYPAAIHTSTTIPNVTSTDGSGPMASKTRVVVSSGEYADDNEVEGLDAIVICDFLRIIVVDKEILSFVVVEDTSSAINDDVYEDKGSEAAENVVTNAGRSIETTNIE